MSTTKIDIRAAGFVLYRRLDEVVQYLLLQAMSKRHWTPPKGRVESGEDELQTAFRETQEEAGFTKDQLNVREDFRRDLHYVVHGDRNKRVVYWLAELRDPTASVALSDEHIAFKWCTISEVLQLIHAFPGMQDVMKDADEFMRSESERKL